MAPKDGFAETMNKFHEPTVPNLGDLMPTHPEPKSSAPASADSFTYNVRYKQFDLSKDTQVEELEELMTAVMEKKKVLRQEKWNTDKDGFTTVTVSWLDIHTKKAAPPKDDKDKTPSEEFGVHIPSIADGQKPGDGIGEDEILAKQREYFLKMKEDALAEKEDG